MGNVLTGGEETLLHPMPTPCFPNTCEKHIHSNRQEPCELCQVYQWYTKQRKALQKVATLKLKQVQEHSDSTRLDNTMTLIETVLVRD